MYAALPILTTGDSAIGHIILIKYRFEQRRRLKTKFGYYARAVGINLAASANLAS